MASNVDWQVVRSYLKREKYNTIRSFYSKLIDILSGDDRLATNFFYTISEQVEKEDVTEAYLAFADHLSDNWSKTQEERVIARYWTALSYPVCLRNNQEQFEKSLRNLSKRREELVSEFADTSANTVWLDYVDAEVRDVFYPAMLNLKSKPIESVKFKGVFASLADSFDPSDNFDEYVFNALVQLVKFVSYDYYK